MHQQPLARGYRACEEPNGDRGSATRVPIVEDRDSGLPRCLRKPVSQEAPRLDRAYQAGPFTC